MAARFFAVVVIILLSVIGIGLFGWWITVDPVPDLTVSLPGEDGRSVSIADKTSDPVIIGEYFETYDGVRSAITASWPRFRGEGFDNASYEPSIPRTLPDDGPRILWSLELGEGHAGAVVSDGRVYILDYLEDKQSDALRCLSLDDGAELWRRWYRVPIKRNHGRSRTVPAVADGFVVTIGPKCHVMCVDAESGEMYWSMDLAAEFGIEVPLWYTGQCPLIDRGIAVFAAGGDSLMVAIDCATGDIVWRTPNPDRLRMSHASIMPMTIHGRHTYVYSAIGGIVGIDPETGVELWRTEEFNAQVIAPSPVYLADGLIWVTAGYGAGSILIRILPDLTVETVSRNRPQEGFACEQQTPLVRDGLLYGVLPKDGGTLRNRFVCWDPFEGLRWSSGETERYGLGPYMVVGDTFLILSDEGVLTAADARADAFSPLWSAKILEGIDSWAPLAYVAGLLIARDSYTIVCVDLRADIPGG